ncbi:helix-turn-helix domain-containing GNAT family N-acetyltransferase [Kitasatospora paranensis]|uniref:Helix-turn-helix domain-containing GNAT family N-acetyltransferase n=1 Tax=Kitasatospora paranensis TaxID=258053 RepID=A0ABW2FRP1_9ACTN
MEPLMIAQVRRFNRTVAQRIGALDDAYLARGRPLGQARLLWEIGEDGADVRSLRARLALDSGYLSRLLRALEADGLIEVEAGGSDGRVRTVRLTAAGRTERAGLDRSSDELAAAILAPLAPAQRTRLVGAMAEVERLLAASRLEIRVTDPGDPAARHCLQAYAAELAGRLDGGFDPRLARPVDDADITAPAGLLLVAGLDGEPVGCGALKFRREGTGWAEVKRVWISPAVRGLGLGRRLLGALESRAAAEGLRTLRLDTNRALTEAIGLYRAAGYREVPAFNDEPYAHHWFEKHLDGTPGADG